MSDNIDKEYEQLVKSKKGSGLDVLKVMQLIENLKTIIPEVLALEKKMGTIEGVEKDQFLDLIINKLRKMEKLGKLKMKGLGIDEIIAKENAKLKAFKTPKKKDKVDKEID